MELLLLLLYSCFIGGLLTCGVFITLRVLNFFDLTCNGTFIFGGALYAYLESNGFSFPIALFLCLIAGISCGVLTAGLNTGFKLPKILSGFISMSILSTFAYNLIPLNGMGHQSCLKIGTLLCLAVASIVVFYRFIVSEFGLQIRAIGGSNTFANTFSFDKSKLTLLGLCISNIFVILAGIISICSVCKSDAHIENFSFLLPLVAILVTDNSHKMRKKSIYYDFIYAVLFGSLYKCLIDLLCWCFGDFDQVYIVTPIVSITLICIHFYKKALNEKNSRDYFWSKKSIYY